MAAATQQRNPAPSGVPGVKLVASTTAKSVPQLREALVQSGIFGEQKRSTITSAEGLLGAAAAAIVVYEFLLKPKPALAAAPGTQPGSTGVTSTYPTGGVVNSPVGTPENLRMLGATAHSVIVTCDQVDNARWYEWHEYPSGLLLARSPSNVAVIQGLQENTTYDVFCVVVDINGNKGNPSQTLLVKTGLGAPVVIVGGGGNGSGGGGGSGSGTGSTPPPNTPPIVTQTQPPTTPQPTYPGLPTSTGPTSGVTAAPPVVPVQITPQTAATAVFSVVSATPVNSPVAAGQRALVDVTIRNVSDVAAGTQVSGYMVLPTGSPHEGTFAPVQTGIIPPGQAVTVRLTSAGRLSYNIDGLAQAGYQLQAVFIAQSGTTSVNGTTIIQMVLPAATITPTTVLAATSLPPSGTVPAPTAAQQTAAALTSAAVQANNPAATAAQQQAAQQQAAAIAAQVAQQQAAAQQQVFKAQLQQVLAQPFVTGQLTSQATTNANASKKGQQLLTQYNSVGTHITQLRAQIGLLIQGGTPVSSAQVQSLMNQWNALASQQSSLSQQLAALPTPQTTPTTSQAPAPNQSVAIGSTVKTYGGGATLTTSGPTQTVSNPGGGYVGSNTYTPVQGGGIYIHGVNGTGFYAPPGSSAYNALVGA